MTTYINRTTTDTPPTGAAGGDLSGTFPNPTILYKPLQWRKILAPVSQAYAATATTLITGGLFTPSPRTRFQPRSWTLPPAVGTVQGGIRFTFSDASTITRSNPFASILYEAADNYDFVKDGLYVTQIEFVGINSSSLVSVTLGSLQIQGEVL